MRASSVCKRPWRGLPRCRPPCCFRRSAPGCRRLVSQPGTLCAAIAGRKLRFLERPWCEVIGTPFAIDMGAGVLSAEAIANPPPFDRARAAVIYTGVARALVQRLKYPGRHRSRALDGGLDGCGPAPNSSPMPTSSCPCRCTGGASCAGASTSRPNSRGLSQCSRPPLRAGNPASASKKTRHQVGLHAERARGQCARRLPRARCRAGSGQGRRLLLVDDVYTTGATVSAVARALKQAGAARVDVLTFARVLPGDFQPDE